MDDNSVIGVSATDSHGLCVQVKGNATAGSAAYLHVIASRAKALSDTGEVPSLCLETDSS